MTLRDVVDADLEVFFAQQSEPEANRVASFPARPRDGFMAHWRSTVLGDDGVGKKTIVTDNDVVAGNVVSWDHAGWRLVGYWIGRAFWGRGIATAAVREFAQKFETRRPLHAFVATDNLGSIRVLEKCGFRRVESDASMRAVLDVEEYLFALE